MKVENEVINREWGGKCRCWAPKFRRTEKQFGGSYCRIILSFIILSFFVRNFNALWIKPIDFFGKNHNNSRSEQHRIDSV